MPKKLVALIALLGILGVFALATGLWIWAGINIVIVIGLLRANGVVRKIAIVFHVLLLGASSWGALLLGAFAWKEGGLGLFFSLALCVIAAAVHAFGLWTLTRSEVISWMLHRRITDLEAHGDIPETF